MTQVAHIIFKQLIAMFLLKAVNAASSPRNHLSNGEFGVISVFSNSAIASVILSPLNPADKPPINSCFNCGSLSVFWIISSGFRCHFDRVQAAGRLPACNVGARPSKLFSVEDRVKHRRRINRANSAAYADRRFPAIHAACIQGVAMRAKSCCRRKYAGRGKA